MSEDERFRSPLRSVSHTTAIGAIPREAAVTFPIANDLAARLEELCARMQWDQAALGEIGGRRREAAGKWLRGESVPGRAVLRTIARAAGGPVEMFEEGGPRPATVELHDPQVRPLGSWMVREGNVWREPYAEPSIPVQLARDAVIRAQGRILELEDEGELIPASRVRRVIEAIAVELGIDASAMAPQRPAAARDADTG